MCCRIHCFSVSMGSQSSPSDPNVDMDFTFLSTIDPNLLCPLCHCPFVDPALCSTCEHVFCHACILESASRVQICPLDRLPIALEQIVPAPRLVKLMVDELVVKCLASDGKCGWSGQRSHWERHNREDCAKASELKCSHGECKETFIDDATREQHEGQCSQRLFFCELCNLTSADLGVRPASSGLARG